MEEIQPSFIKKRIAAQRMENPAPSLASSWALPLACGPIWVASSWVITPPGNPGGHCFIVVRAPLAAAARSSLRFAIASLWSKYASFGHWNLRNFGHVCAKEGQATVDRTLKTEEQGISDVVGCPLAQCRFSLFPRRDSPAELFSSMRTDQN